MQLFEWLWQDLRYGLRTLWKDRRFAAVAILALALGIGATVVAFSVVDGVLLEPFPIRDSGRFVVFQIHGATWPKEAYRLNLTVPEFTAVREQAHVFEDMIGFSHLNVLYTTPQGTDFFDGCWVTGNVSTALGMQPILGRPIGPQDAAPDSPPVFAMSDRLWARRFSRDPKIVGTVMTLDGASRTLVEILPPRFVLNGCDVWIPIYAGHADIDNNESGNTVLYLANSEHLKPGVSLRTAEADVNVTMHHVAAMFPADFPKDFTVQLETVADYTTGNFKGMLFALMGAVLMLLLIACSNIANLLLARATAREKEIAIRASLGASRGRLVRQLLVESFLLSAAGCLLGCFLAYFGLKELNARVPIDTLTPSISLEINFRVLLFAVGIALLTTILCGLAPAIHAVYGPLQAHLSGTGKGMSAGSRHGRLRAVLVVVEVALSVLLLAGAGLLMRSLLALQHVDLGLDPTNVLFANVAMPNQRYSTSEQKKAFVRQVLEHVRALPGVTAATVTSGLPPFSFPDSDIDIPGKTHAQIWAAEFELADENYFKTLGLSLIRGRLISEQDVASEARVIVINQAFQRQYFKDEDPIGKMVKFNVLDRVPDAPHGVYFQIVGIVSDMRNNGLREPPMAQAFMPYAITGIGTSRSFLIKTAVDPLSMMPQIQRAIWDVDPNVAFSESGTLESYLHRYGYAQPEFGLITLGAFAGIGLALVIVGVFSVMAYSVSLQTHEIGVRMALGAQQSDILRMVLARGLALIVAGITIGLVASFGLTRFLSSQIWGVSATDPWTFAAVSLVILLVGLVACALPSRAATRVDPMVALRYE